MTMTAPTAPAPASTGGLRPVLLVAGPALTLLALLALSSRGAISEGGLGVWLVVAAVAWSPLPLSIPAVLLDHERDTALPGRSGLVRAVALVPWLMFSARSTVRGLMATSLVMWVLFLAAATLVA